MKDVSEISYTSASGAILPELQWHEQILITRGKVTFARNGRATKTRINAGIWELAVDERKIATLFAQLEAVNCARIKRVEPADPPDGGGAEGYTIVYGRGKTCSLVFDPGVTYTGGETIVDPVTAFIQGLALPADAASRYRFAP